MILRDSYLMLMTLCSFVYFHVTADLDTNKIYENVQDDQFNFKHSFFAEEDILKNKMKRETYQKPLLNNPSPINEDWKSVARWPVLNGITLGNVGGVSINSRGEVVVFHRGDHVWGAHTFSPLNEYRPKDEGPITAPTVLVFHPETGAVLQKWGENMFYMPHGITLDREDNVWLTDVALHQIFKFPPLSTNQRSPLLTLGERFVPGNSAVRFCKPTSIAITSWGDFFVADGYCNSRLIKFNKAGEKIMEIGHSSFNFGLFPTDPYSFLVPHALTLVNDRKLVCVADRENGRVLCFDWNNGTFVFHISSPQIGSLIYSVAYSPANGGLFYLVNGQERYGLGHPVRGYVLSASSLRLISYFGDGLKTPHDLAVSIDGKQVFVGEIGPNIVHKYSHNASLGSNVNTIPTTTFPQHSLDFVSPQPLTGLSNQEGTVLPAILVTCAAVLFGAAIVTAALVYSRARRRGRSSKEKAFRMETISLVDDEEP